MMVTPFSLSLANFIFQTNSLISRPNNHGCVLVHSHFSHLIKSKTFSLQDPELMAAFSDPEIMAALQDGTDIHIFIFIFFLSKL